MSWTSSVPAALSALISLFSEGVGVRVIDGPFVVNSDDWQVLAVGCSSTDDDVAVDNTNSPAGWDTGRDREEYQVRCAVMVLAGDIDVSAARTRAYKLFGSAGDVLAANPTLGGVVLRASLGDSTLRQMMSDNGLIVSVTFSINISAFTQGA